MIRWPVLILAALTLAPASAKASPTPAARTAAAAPGRTLAEGAARRFGEAVAGALDPKDGPDVDLRILIEDEEIRLQIITNLAFIDATTDAWRELATSMSATEGERTAEALVELFEGANRVSIDGVEVEHLEVDPAEDLEFDPGDPSLYPYFSNYGARAVAKTRLTLRYPCKTPPERVAIVWGVYPPNETLPEEGGVRPAIEIMSRLTADGRERIVRFSKDEPEFTWHRPDDGERDYLEEVPEVREVEAPPLPWLRFGLVAAALAGLAFGPRALRRTLFGPLAVGAGAWLAVGLGGRDVELPDEARAEAIFRPLHTNIYKAFDFTERTKVYDVLARSADGEVLRTLYDDVYRSLVMQEEGGAVGRVETLEYEDVEIESIGELARSGNAGITLTAKWRVKGAVYHWGHAHSQESEYAARYVVEAGEAGWRITDYVPLAQRRVDAKPLPELESRREPAWRRAGDEDLPDEF